MALGAGALAAPLASFGQQSTKVFRIGYLGPVSEANYVRRGILEALRSGLRDLGYVEGKNIVIEFRFADSKLDRLAGLAAELVGRKVDVIVTHSNEGVVAASRATSTIPIVFAAAGDVVALGLAANLARPRGNMTGSIFFANELSAKRVQLIKETMPRITQVAVPLVRSNPGNAGTLQAMGMAAKVLKVELQTFEVVGPSDFDSAFAAMAKKRINAVVLSDHPLFINNGKVIADIAAAKRMPSIGYNEHAANGGVIGYGVDFVQLWRRVGFFVDKIFKGTNPGDIPIEQASQFEMIVNRKTAKTLGVKIPNSILAQTTRVID